jgi:hypothetical protein
MCFGSEFIKCKDKIKSIRTSAYRFIQGCTNSGCLVYKATKLCTVNQDDGSSSLHKIRRNSSHVTIIKRHIRASFKSRARILDPQYRTSFMTHFWRLKFESVAYILRTFVVPCYSESLRIKKKANSTD